MSRLPSWLKAALWTSLQAFVATFALGVLGLLQDVQDWIDSGGTDPIDLSTFGNLVFSAFIALVAGIVTAIHRQIQSPEQAYTEKKTE